jgi:hypothetical protein
MSEETTKEVEATVREIRRRTRKKYSAEEKVRTPALACWCQCRIGRLTWGGKDCGVVPPGRHPPEYVLQMEQGISGGRQAAIGGGYKTRSRQPRSGGDAQRERAAQGRGGRTNLEEPRTEKKLVGQGNEVGRMIRRDEAEKREVIHLVEQSALSVKKTLDELLVPRTLVSWVMVLLAKSAK